MTDRPGRRPPPPLGSREQLGTHEGQSNLWRFLLWIRKNSVGIPGGWKNTEPNAVQVGGTGDAGNGNTAGWMAADATLAVPVGVPSGLGNANAEGSADAVSRQDHIHKRDVRVKKAGVDVGTRNALNFINGSNVTITVADNAGADRVDITIASSGGGGGDYEMGDLEMLDWIL
ncbi:MAG TPA: hypothetical protein VFG76_10700 [Candidatus Polarisedimenticolia bacterium]|nr:hypothetical protein [Candidatus Polarisedimenticolia bacterium]